MNTVTELQSVKTLKKIARQQGMTLIELAVVLLVLVGLAGLTLPYVGGFIQKTHNSTSSASGADLYNALAEYQALNGGYPNNLNSLNTGGGLAQFLDDSFAGAGTPSSNFLSTALTSNGLASLNGAGIFYVATLNTGTSSSNGDGTFSFSLSNGATFTPEIPGKQLAAGTLLATDSLGGLTAAAGSTTAPYTSISAALGGYTVVTGHQLIVLGVGPVNSAIGKTLGSVPVHFGDQPVLQPTYTYSRFLAAFDVDQAGGSNAKLVGIVHAPDTGDKWESVYSSISSYYSN